MYFCFFEAQTYYENVDILFILKEKNINKFKCVNLKKKNQINKLIKIHDLIFFKEY